MASGDRVGADRRYILYTVSPEAGREGSLRTACWRRARLLAALQMDNCRTRWCWAWQLGRTDAYT